MVEFGQGPGMAVGERHGAAHDHGGRTPQAHAGEERQ